MKDGNKKVKVKKTADFNTVKIKRAEIEKKLMESQLSSDAVDKPKIDAARDMDRAKKLIEEKNIDISEALDEMDRADGLEIKDEYKNAFHRLLHTRLALSSFLMILAGFILMSFFVVKAATVNVSVVLDDDDPVKIRKIGHLTTAQALKQANITLAGSDYISKGLDESLKNNETLRIRSAGKVIVTDGKRTVRISTGLMDKKDVVRQAGFKPRKNRKISSLNYRNTSVYALLKSNQKLISKKQKVKYKTVYKEVKTLGGKEEKILKKGVTGQNNLISIVSVNRKGKVISSKPLTNTVERKAQNRVVAIALDQRTVMIDTANGKAPARYKEKYNVNVTAYCPCVICCGKTNGITASGTHATPFRTVAAWSGLPFGTKVYFPALSGNPNKGVYVVEDRGGAITSSRIDIFFANHSQALQFGRRNLEMYVLQ